jgi:large subunit ribosomal protein L9
MKQKLLLLQDVDSLGKKGEIVTARPGYVRNFLLPYGFAVVASPNTLRSQEKLKKEREAQAKIDREEASQLAAQLATIQLQIRVKVDPEGHMYGSVSSSDIARLFQEQGLPVEKKYIQLTRPIKETGVHKIHLKLKEGLPVVCDLMIIPEGAAHLAGIESVVAPIVLETEEQSPKDTE